MSDVYFVVDPQYSATRNRDRDDSGSYGQDYHQLDWVEMDAQQLEDFFNSNEMYQDKFGSFENYQNYMDEYMGVIDNFLQSRGQSLEIASGISSELGGSLTDWVIGELTNATDPQKLEDFGNEALLGNLQTSALNDKYGVGASTGDGYFIGEDGDLWLSYWNGQGYSNMKMQEIDTYASTGDIVKGIATVIAGAYAAGIPAAVAETGAITGAQAIQLANNVYNQYENVQDVEETTVTEEAPPEFTLDPSIIDEAGTIIDEFGNIIGTNFLPTFDTGGGGGEEAGAEAPQEEVVDIAADSTVDATTGLEDTTADTSEPTGVYSGGTYQGTILTGPSGDIRWEDRPVIWEGGDSYGGYVLVNGDPGTWGSSGQHTVVGPDGEVTTVDWEEGTYDVVTPPEQTTPQDTPSSNLPTFDEPATPTSTPTTTQPQQPTEEGVTVGTIIDTANTIGTILGDSSDGSQTVTADGTATGTATEGTGTADGGAEGGAGGGANGGTGTGTGSGEGDGSGETTAEKAARSGFGDGFTPFYTSIGYQPVQMLAPVLPQQKDYMRELDGLFNRTISNRKQGMLV